MKITTELSGNQVSGFISSAEGAEVIMGAISRRKIEVNAWYGTDDSRTDNKIESDGMLDAMERADVFRVKKHGDVFRLSDGCDVFNHVDLTSEQIVALADELRALVNG